MQARTSASGRSAVTVVERIVHAPPEPAPEVRVPRRGEWVFLLHELTRQLDTGLLYDRDFPAVAEAVGELVAAIDRRTRYRRR